MTNSSVSLLPPALRPESDGAPRPIGSDDADSFHIIGVDPGLVAGVAVLTVAYAPYIDGGIAVTMSTKEWPWQEAVTYIERWCREPEARKLSIGSERYTIPTGRNAVTAQLDAIECNGALRWLSSQRDVTFELQPRAEVKKQMTDKVLRKLGWFKKTKDGHANDAARNAGYRLFVTRPELWLRLTDGV